MGDSQDRVTFDFSGAREVHYIDAVPDVGDLITHGGDLWMVREVEPDDVGVVVTCKLHGSTRSGEHGAFSREAVSA
jgi:hypothetical protein